jgi:hypothetical protein
VPLHPAKNDSLPGLNAQLCELYDDTLLGPTQCVDSGRNPLSWNNDGLRNQWKNGKKADFQKAEIETQQYS